jgi:hypothetical protein
MKRGLVVVLLFAAFCAPAHAGGPAMLVGVAEDEVPKPSLVQTKANMALLKLAGFDSVRISALWGPGKVAPTPTERTLFANVQTAARLTGIHVFLTVYNNGNRFTPLTETDRAQFVQFAVSLAKAYPLFRDIIVGNEPNNNRFWLPQFGLDGSDAAAPAYLALLAQTYDALKAVSPAITVIGGALEPRGGDNPAATKPTHSPTQLLLDLGEAYRESGRTTPIMDELAMHPYQDNSSQPPTAAHPNTKTISISDYPKLVSVLGQAFDGTAQPGSTLPLVYAEYGVETTIPARKSKLYTGTEPPTIHPVSEATQGLYYRQAIGIAFCQPNVRAILIFHAFDEPSLDRWQSGVYYTDRTPKPDVGVVREAAAESRRGVVARCPGLALSVKSTLTAPATAVLARAAHVYVGLRCDIDCNYVARVQRLPAGTIVQTARGRATGGTRVTIRFARRLGAGRYRFAVRTVAAVNPGRTVLTVSRSFRIPPPKR